MSNSLVQPYLFYSGRAEEAINFYKSAIGAEVEALIRFNENPDLKQNPDLKMPIAENWGEKIMHASLRLGETNVFISDGHGPDQPSFQGFALSLSVLNEADADRAFNALQSDGGKITMPLGKTFFSSRFGMLTDRFGVGWMVIVPV